jgi:hypothetical protein
MYAVDLNTIRQTIIDSSREDWNKLSCCGPGAGPAYWYGLSSARGEHGVATEARSHANFAVLIDDVEISIAWGYNPDESLLSGSNGEHLDFSDVLPALAGKSLSRVYADVFYRGALVDRKLYAVADGGYVPIPRITYPHQTSDTDRGDPEYHYTRWDLGFAIILNSFGQPEPFDQFLAKLEYIFDDDMPISSESI